MSKNKRETPRYRPCVGIMLLNPQGQVWIGRRIASKRSNDPNGAGLWWQMPQGGIDKGEEPLEAAFRELHEETGIEREQVTLLAETHGWHRYDLPENVVGRKWGGRYRGQAQKWFLLRYDGPDSAIDIAKHDLEFARWRWSSADEVLRDIVPFKRAVYDKVIAEFRARL